MSDYPTQDFVKAQIKAGKWPAKEGEVLDIRSLSDSEIKIIELYNQEEIIKQQRKTNELLDRVAAVFCNDYDVDDLADEVKEVLTKFTGNKK